MWIAAAVGSLSTLPSHQKQPYCADSTDSGDVLARNMKLIIGRPDETEVVLAEQVDGAWKPNPNIASEMVSFLQGADPEQFEMWVEEPE